MPENKGLKAVMLVGAAIGAILSVTFTVLMDVLYADSLGGTWRDAIVNDMHSLFSVSYDPHSFVVTLLYILIILILALFGALLGALFTTFSYKFLSLLTRESGSR